MAEQRRHQRIRFSEAVTVRVGQEGVAGEAALENLSLGGLLLRSSCALQMREMCGVEIEFPGQVRISLSVHLVNQVGERYGARFSPGPLSEALIRQAVREAVAAGRAASLSVKVQGGRRMMRVFGCLDNLLREDFLYALKAGVAEIDLSGVTVIDATGVELCRLAQDDRRAVIVRPSACVQAALAGPAAALRA